MQMPPSLKRFFKLNKKAQSKNEKLIPFRKDNIQVNHTVLNKTLFGFFLYNEEEKNLDITKK